MRAMAIRPVLAAAQLADKKVPTLAGAQQIAAAAQAIAAANNLRHSMAVGQFEFSAAADMVKVLERQGRPGLCPGPAKG